MLNTFRPERCYLHCSIYEPSLLQERQLCKIMSNLMPNPYVKWTLKRCCASLVWDCTRSRKRTPGSVIFLLSGKCTCPVLRSLSESHRVCAVRCSSHEKFSLRDSLSIAWVEITYIINLNGCQFVQKRKQTERKKHTTPFFNHEMLFARKKTVPVLWKIGS